MGNYLKKTNKIIYLFMLMGMAFLQACGEPPQISGIVAVTDMETVACVAHEKTFEIRNSNTEEPQRVQGVLFEYGTNEDRFFKITEITANGLRRDVAGNLEEEVILAPGEVMEVTVQYKPREVTYPEDAPHTTYLDFVLNGPKLGIMQIEIHGRAPTALEGCEAGAVRVFDVVSASTVLSHVSVGDDEVPVPDVTGKQLLLTEELGKVYILPENWPRINLEIPPNPSGITNLDIFLNDETEAVEFDDQDLTFENTTFSAGGAITLSGVKLTTGSITLNAANAVDGSLTVQGSPFDEGDMTLVAAAVLTGNAAIPNEIKDGVFALKLELKEKK